MGRAVTYTREQRNDSELTPLDHAMIRDRCDAIVNEDWPTVVEGLFLPIVIEDLFSAYVAKHGLSDLLGKTALKFWTFRRKRLNSWAKFHHTSKLRGLPVVDCMLRDMLDPGVDGYELFRVTRTRADAALADRL